MPRRRAPSFPVLVTVAYCVASIGAVAWVVIASLKTNAELLSSSPFSLPQTPSLESYFEAWEGGNLGAYVVASVMVTAVSVIAGICVSAPAAYALARIRFRLNTAVRTALLVGILVPAFSIVIPLYFMLHDLGLLNSYVGLTLVYVAIQVPFTVFVLTPFFARLPSELEEAAYIDGAGAARTFLFVMVPLAVPAIVSLGILNGIAVWNEYFVAFLLQAGGDQLTLPLGLARLAFAAEFRAEWSELFAGVILTMIPMLVLFAIFQRRIEQGLTAGALK